MMGTLKRRNETERNIYGCDKVRLYLLTLSVCLGWVLLACEERQVRLIKVVTMVASKNWQ